MALNDNTKRRLAGGILIIGAFTATGLFIRGLQVSSKQEEAVAREEVVYTKPERIDPIRFKEDIRLKDGLEGTLFVIKYGGDCVTNSMSLRKEDASDIDEEEMSGIDQIAIKLEMTNLINICRGETKDSDISTSFK